MADYEGLAVVPEDVAAVGRFAYRIATELRDGASSLDSEVSALINTWRGAAARPTRPAGAICIRVWFACGRNCFSWRRNSGVTAENYRTQEDESAVSLGLLNLDVP